MAKDDFWSAVGKAAVVNWMLDFPQLKQRAAAAGWTDEEVHGIVAEANRRIRSLKEEVRKLGRERDHYYYQMLEREEMMDELELALMETRQAAASQAPALEKPKPRFRERRSGSKPRL